MTFVKKTQLEQRNNDNGYHNSRDQFNEDRVADALWHSQSIKLHQFAKFSPVDYWLEKNGKVAGIAELKTSFKKDIKGFAYLNVRKYMYLQTAAMGFGCNAYFINQRLNGDIYISDINKLEGEVIIVDRGLEGKNEREPVKAVPLRCMYKL
ncbi:MAG: hypothetical protein Unbinned2514contig1001_11 [Prokaryotic dsDNA virus sp.]|nr:MAG: hypothetical protein Unbinned2514contig1001_11 [Prokaryotic dsDNA virus sp.]|tara:strand:- start:11204 stop:11656 length:453 start_codon:yes stop_codon:yes gene_type:complete